MCDVFRARYQLLLSFFGIVLLTSSGLWAQMQPDNTKVNSSPAVTAGQQSNTRSDLETTRQIRKAIISEKSLSTYAHNVKIVTKGGKVTLRGPVRSEEEKNLVASKASDVAGAANVTNEITVKSTPATSTTTSKTSTKKAGE